VHIRDFRPYGGPGHAEKMRNEARTHEDSRGDDGDDGEHARDADYATELAAWAATMTVHVPAPAEQLRLLSSASHATSYFEQSAWALLSATARSVLSPGLLMSEPRRGPRASAPAPRPKKGTLLPR